MSIISISFLSSIYSSVRCKLKSFTDLTAMILPRILTIPTHHGKPSFGPWGHHGSSETPQRPLCFGKHGRVFFRHPGGSIKIHGNEGFVGVIPESTSLGWSPTFVVTMNHRSIDDIRTDMLWHGFFVDPTPLHRVVFQPMYEYIYIYITAQRLVSTMI